MQTRQYVTVDGNEAAASIAHRLSEVIAIYPITPASPMGNWPTPGPRRAAPIFSARCQT